MMGIGATELFVIAALALMLFSPRELPNILRSVMRFWGSIKRTADDFKDAIMQEEAMQELREAYKGTKDVVRKAETDARRELMKARTEVRKAQGKLAQATKLRETSGGAGAAQPVAKRAATPSSDPRSTVKPEPEPKPAPETKAAKPEAATGPGPAPKQAPDPASKQEASA